MADKPTKVQTYIDSKPLQVQQKLLELRSYLQLADPMAHDELKWGKPALVNDGIVFVYAGFKNHISLHPTPSVITAMRELLSGYVLSGNTIQFPLDKPLPKELIMHVASLRVHEKTVVGIGWK